MQRLLIYISLILILASCHSNQKDPVSKKASDKELDEYQLVWSDEFNYSGLPDSSKWAYDTEGNEAGWGNNEAQYYTRANEANAWVKDGVLHITARKEEFGGKEFTHHPDSKFNLGGFKIPFFKEACMLAISTVEYIPDRWIGWDIAITPGGPIIIEANDCPSIFVSDITSGGLLKNQQVKKLVDRINQKSYTL